MSVAQIIVMSHDFTHSIHLEGENKEKWDKYCEGQKNDEQSQGRPLTRMEQEEQRVLAEIAAEKKAEEEKALRDKVINS